MAFPDTTPRKGDSDNNLLFKIAQELSERNGGAFPPMLGDSDNNLLYKIAQLIILGGGTAGTCAADLATCNALTTSLQAQLAACQAIVPPQDMLWSWTPTSFNLGETAGITLDASSSPTTLTFRGATNSVGRVIAGQSSLTTLTFLNLLSNPAGTTLGTSIQSNPVLATVSFPALTTSATLFTLTSNAALTSFSVPVLNSVTASFTLTGSPLLTTISFPSLTTISSALSIATGNTALTTANFPVLVTYNGSLSLATRTNLTSVNFASLVSAPTTIAFNGCTSLTTLSFPSLVTGGTSASGFNTSGSTALTALNFPNWLPTNTRPLNFGTCALNQASVDHVLARAVANAAYVSGTITLNGGTNSTPSAAGLANKAILVGRGVTVLNN